jgi:glutamine synthetase
MDNKSSPEGKGIIEAFLSDHVDVRFIRVQWVDLSGVLRTRILTKAHCLRLASEGKFTTVSASGVLFPVSPLQYAEVPPQGSIELQPDWSSLRLCHYARGHASVMCFASLQDAKHPYFLCARSLLAEAVTNAKDAQDVEFLVGFEVEFALLDAEHIRPDSKEPFGEWSATSGLRKNNLVAMEEVVAILEASNIAVEKFHTEGEGQIEIATGPLQPMDAVDALMYTHETIKHVLSKYNVRVTMAPVPWFGSPANGAHTHVSMNPSSMEESFLAGILESLRAICAFSLPNYDSFTRVEDFRNGAGSWVSWGTQNRDVPIRKIDSGHWEIRCVDATANFYLVIFLIISAGLRGLEEGQPLTMGDCLEYPTRLGKAKLAEIGVHEQLPRSMREAIEVLKSDTSLNRILSADLKKEYVNVKEVDEVALGKMTDDERRQLFTRVF